MGTKADDEEGSLSRRRFLGLAGGAAGTAWLLGPGAADAAGQIVPDDPIGPVTIPLGTRVFRRPDDQAALTFSFTGWALQRRSGLPSRIVRTRTSARIAVGLPPQAVVERVIAPSDLPPSTPGNGGFRFAAPSRLVFDIPGSITAIDLTDEALLDWDRWVLRVAPRARVGATQGLTAYRAPTTTETSIELPWMVVISPNENTTFVSNAAPKHGESGRVEAWEARLAVRSFALPGQPTQVSEHTERDRAIRAIWLRDPQAPGWIADPNSAPSGSAFAPGYPFPMALTPRQRARIVRNTSGFGSPGTPVAAPVEHLRLGAFGGVIDTSVRFDDPVAPGLESWIHKTTQGRDHYVRTVSPGYLLPWGFRAAIISVTERQLVDAAGGAGSVAPLVKREYVVIRDPFVQYNPATLERDDIALRNDGRKLPFVSARLRAKASPLLAPAHERPEVGDGGQSLVLEDGTRLLWDVVLTDKTGRDSVVSMPLTFVDDGINRDRTRLLSVAFAHDSDESLRRVDFRGQPVAFTPELEPGQSTLPTDSIDVFLLPRSSAPLTAFGLEPSMTGAEVSLPATGVTGGASPTTEITYYGPYVTSGFGPSEVWARLPDPVALDFRADRSGGVLLPSTSLEGVSRSLGLIGGDVDTMASGEFDPESWFGGITSKLLGCVDLASVIEGGAQPPDAIPKLTTTQLPDAVEHRYAWRPKLKSTDVFEAGSGRGEVIASVRAFPGDPSRTEVDVRGELGRCTLYLPPRNRVGGEWRTDDVILTLPFDGIRFGSRNGQRPELDVDIDVDKISFGGPLDFVRGLRQYLSFGGDDGPSVEITDEAIAVDISAELPDIKLGVFSLYDLSFSGGVELPLDGGPVLTRFGLGTPSNPFHLTCFGIGGGGYFQIATAGGELARLTLGLEAGCEVAIDFGPFSAGIGCYVGIVITLQSDGDLTFVGYFRMFGEIDLAIASASISLYIGLEYRSASGDLYGRATLVIEVTVLFFSESLEFEVERRFNSCDNDPPFRDMLDAPAWSQYCAAFGPVVHETARDGIGGPFS